MRTVKVFSTRDGKQIHKVETEARTWGELRPVLEDMNLYSTSMSAIESVTKVTLEHADIVLPEGDFLLMMVPKNTKAGTDYVVTDEDIEDFLEEFEALVTKFFNDKVSDPELKELQEGIESFMKGLK